MRPAHHGTGCGFVGRRLYTDATAEGRRDRGAPRVVHWRYGAVPTPGPTNSAQLRLNRLPPVAPPVTVRNTRKYSCVPFWVPVGAIGNVWLVQVAAPPVETRLFVCTIGPVVGESWRISTAASGEPAVRPSAESATR